MALSQTESRQSHARVPPQRADASRAWPGGNDSTLWPGGNAANLALVIRFGVRRVSAGRAPAGLLHPRPASTTWRPFGVRRRPPGPGGLPVQPDAHLIDGMPAVTLWPRTCSPTPPLSAVGRTWGNRYHLARRPSIPSGSSGPGFPPRSAPALVAPTTCTRQPVFPPRPGRRALIDFALAGPGDRPGTSPPSARLCPRCSDNQDITRQPPWPRPSSGSDIPARQRSWTGTAAARYPRRGGQLHAGVDLRDRHRAARRASGLSLTTGRLGPRTAARARRWCTLPAVYLITAPVTGALRSTHVSCRV